MARDECPDCWCDPCECGHRGYVVLWLPIPYRGHTDDNDLVHPGKPMPADRYDALKAHLEREMGLWLGTLAPEGLEDDDEQ